MALGSCEVYRFLVLSTVAACIWSQESDTTSPCTSTTCKNGGTCSDTIDYAIPEAFTSCPVGWPLYHAGKCYKVLWKGVNWTEANLLCKQIQQSAGLMALDEGVAIWSEFIKLMNYTHFNLPYDLWTSACDPSSCQVLDAKKNYLESTNRIASLKAVPVCSISASQVATQIGSQCRCNKPYIGLQCEQNERNANISDQTVCPGRPITCPSHKYLFFDYASYDEQIINQTHSCRSPPSPTASRPNQDRHCNPYNASARAVVRQLCQGKRRCNLSSFLEKCDTSLRIRYRCYPINAMTCTEGHHFIQATNDCVTIFQNPSTWWEALDECRTLGGSLAFLPNTPRALRELSSWLNGTSSLSGSVPQYYSMSPHYEETFEVWIGEVTKDLASPSVDPQGKCSYLRVDITNETITVVTDQGLHCTTAQSKYGLCQMELTDQGDCPHRSIRMDSIGTCHRLMTEKGTLGELQAVCEGIGGRLASYFANNTEQKQNLFNILSHQYSQELDRREGFWIAGIGDIRDPEGEWLPCATAIMNETGTIEYQKQSTCRFNGTKRAICTFPRILSGPVGPTLPPPIPTSSARCNETHYVDRNVTWPETTGGTTASVLCPGKNTQGIATWKCGLNGKFEGTPNFRSCSSLNVTEIMDAIHKLGENAAVEGPRVLFNRINEHRQLHSQDIEITIDIMKDLRDRQKDLLNSLTNIEERQSAVENISNSMGDVIDSLLSENNVAAWTDMSSEYKSQKATEFLASTSELGFMLADALANSTQLVEKKNIELKMSNKHKDIYGTSGISFPDAADAKTSISLSEGFALESGAADEHNNVKSVFVKYKNNMTALLSAVTLSIERKTNTSNDTTFQVNSDVMGASLRSPNETFKFKTSHVKIAVKHLNKHAENPTCAFWNTMTNGWDNKGCKTHSTTTTQTVCECDHLTNFAVLMDVHNKLSEADKAHTVALTWITIVGCSISIVCLSISCVVFIFFRQLWGLRNAIHCNLCACLLIAQILLLGGLDRTENKIVCSVIAGVLHFTWLAAFMWMVLEGVQIYILLIRVFDTGEQKTWLYYIAGYGVPAIIVAVSAGIMSNGYGTERYCWLSTDNNFIFSFAAPMAAMFLFNMVILVMAMKAAASVKMQRQQTKTKSAKVWIRRAASLIPLLGLTWVFGFLFVDNESIVFAYIFAVSNSLQGVFIFVYHCMRNEKVQQVVGRYFYKKKDQFESSSATKSRSNSCTGASNARTMMTDDGSSTSSTQSRGKVSKSAISTLTGVPKAKGLNKWRQKLDISNKRAVSPEFFDQTFSPRNSQMPPDLQNSPHKRSKIPISKVSKVRKISEQPV